MLLKYYTNSNHLEASVKSCIYSTNNVKIAKKMESI